MQALGRVPRAQAAVPAHRGRHVVRVVGVIAALLLAVSVAWHLGAFSPRPTLRSLMESPAAEDISPRDVTGEVCPALDCAAAWDTRVGRFVEFRQDGDAHYWETVLGDDARRDRRILVDFSGGDHGREHVRQAVDVLFSGRDWT